MAEAVKNYDIGGEVDINGIKIHYEYFGKKNRPAMIIFNGVAMESKSWYQFVPLATKNMDLLLWDYRGQGQSTSDDNPYKIEDFADYLKAVIDKVGLKPEYTNLVGASTGTIIEAEFLRKYSKSVNKAIMSGVILTNEKNFQYQSSFGVRLLREGHLSLWGDSLYGSLFSDTYLAKIEPYIPKMKQALYERYKERPLALSRIIEAQAKYVGDIDKYHPEFKQVKTPILIISGAEDKITPIFYQKKVQNLFPQTSYKEYPGCAHILYMESTEQFFKDCDEFFLK